MADPPPLETAPPCATTQDVSSTAALAPSTTSDANGRSEQHQGSTTERLAAVFHSEVQDAYVRGGIDMAARQFDLVRSEFSAQRERDLALAYQRGLEQGRAATSERSVAGNEDDGPSRQHPVRNLQQAAARPELENIHPERRQHAPEETLLSIGRRTIDRRRDARPLRNSQPMFSERQRHNLRATFQGLLNTGPAPQRRQEPTAQQPGQAEAPGSSQPSAQHPTDLRAEAVVPGRPSATQQQQQRESDPQEMQQDFGAASLRETAASSRPHLPPMLAVPVAAGGLQIQSGQTQTIQRQQPAPPGSASAPDAQQASLEGRRRRCRGKGSERRRKAARALHRRG